MPRYKYIRIKGKPRRVINVELLAAALIQHDLLKRREREAEQAKRDSLANGITEPNEPDDDVDAG